MGEFDRLLPVTSDNNPSQQGIISVNLSIPLKKYFVCKVFSTATRQWNIKERLSKWVSAMFCKENHKEHSCTVNWLHTTSVGIFLLGVRRCNFVCPCSFILIQTQIITLWLFYNSNKVNISTIYLCTYIYSMHHLLLCLLII